VLPPLIDRLLSAVSLRQPHAHVVTLRMDVPMRMRPGPRLAARKKQQELTIHSVSGVAGKMTCRRTQEFSLVSSLRENCFVKFFNP